jgi:tetratricopeptide (TPR) repeat protein
LWSRHDYDGAEQLVRSVADSGRADDAMTAEISLVNVEVLRGRLHEAERQFARANDAYIRVTGDTSPPYLVAHFHAALEGQLRGDEARGIATLDSVLRAVPLESVPVDRDQSPWVAVGYAQLGAPEKARELLRRHEARLDSLRRRREAGALARATGMIALAEGKPDSAIAWFHRSDTGPDGLPSNDCPFCTPLLTGLAFDREGQADSARIYLTRYVEMPATGRAVIDRFYLAPALFRLGELYESARDTTRAIEYYGRFVDLWKNADSELQPRVTEVRARLEQLNRGKR